MASTRPRRVTSADIAREVGLSRATVSYVLNDTPHHKIPEATQRRVREAAARLGYSPSAAARALRSGRSHIVLCLLPDWHLGPVISRFLELLSSDLADHGLTLLTHPRTGSDRPAKEVWDVVNPDVVLGLHQFTEDEITAMEAAGITVTMVVLNREHPRRGLIDHHRIGRMQIEYLAGNGHRSFGYAGTNDPRFAGFAIPRLEGARDACSRLGLDEPITLTLSGNPAQGSVQVQDWLRRDPPVTAVCAYNDDVAFALLAAMRLSHLEAPHDLAVIGVDDIPTAAYAAPPLTTIHIDREITARYASQMVTRALEGRPPPRRPGPKAIFKIVRRQTA